MRPLTVLAVLALTTACSNENELRFTSTLDAQTRGVALTDEGLDAYVGMIDTTCTIDTNWGCPTEDVDLPSEEDRILDHFSGDTLGGSPDGVHIIRGQAWQADLDVSMPGVRAAALRSDGLLMLAGVDTACALHLPDGDTVSAPASACAESAHLAFDRDGAGVFASTDTGLMHVSRDGVNELGDLGDLVAFDETLDVIYVAQTGGTTISALRPNGAVVWEAAAPGPISSIAARGRLGQALVLSTATDGFGELARLDGIDGDSLGAYRLPDAGCEITTSENGRTIGCVFEEQVNFYELEADLDVQVVDENVPANCIDPIDRRTLD